MPDTVDVLVQIPMDSAKGEDMAVNTFHFTTFQAQPEPGNITALQIRTALSNFYLTCGPYLSTDLHFPLAKIKMYRSTDTPIRVPFYEGAFEGTITTGTTTLPHQLAICLSFSGDPVSGTPMRRRRGRIYLGPLASAAVGSSGELASGVAAQLASNCKALADAGTPTGFEWAIFSRRGSKPPTPPTVVAITKGFVDTSVDVIRRRKVDATTRSSWVAA